MKTALLTIIIACIAHISVHAQFNQNNRLRKDAVPSIDLPNKKYKLNADALQKFKEMDMNKIDNMLSLNKSPFDQNRQLEVSSSVTMPCLKPEGNFKMQIIKPDSSPTYSMPIKKF